MSNRKKKEKKSNKNERFIEKNNKREIFQYIIIFIWPSFTFFSTVFDVTNS